MITYKTNIPQFKLLHEPSGFQKAKISTSRDSEQFIRQFYFEDISIYESFFILLLNQAHNTTGYAKISQGGMTATVVDPRLVAKYAVEGLAARIILAHNHPSGNLQPSEADRQLTQRIKDGLALLEIKVLDHIILAPEGGYYSFADEGLL